MNDHVDIDYKVIPKISFEWCYYTYIICIRVFRARILTQLLYSDLNDWNTIYLNFITDDLSS